MKTSLAFFAAFVAATVLHAGDNTIKISAPVDAITIYLSGAGQDASTGNVKWKYTVNPDETKKIDLSFAIKYPKNKVLTTRKFRTISAPSF